MEDFNINEIIGSFLSHKADDLTSLAKSGMKKINQELSLKLKSKYTTYLKNLTTRYGKTRSFFIRGEPKPLYQFYEPIGISSENNTLEKANILDVVSINTRVLILGSGGAGKSILLKHFLLDSLSHNYKVPIFIELRDSNNKNHTLIELINVALRDFELDVDESYLLRGLEEGHFIIFLDGLDEVKNSLRSDLIRDIEDFSEQYDKCSYVLSTRPDDKISEFERFTFFHTLPLTLEQSVSLIGKLPAEEEIKEKFIEDLKSGLFEKHNSFLSNPLLLSIMLLTYGFSADIPNRLSIFYNQAYEALFQRHDALKGAYKRDRESDLDIISFERVLSAFCILSYDDRKFLFSRVEALQYIRKGADLVGVKINQDHFLNDLMQAVCFLIQDGLFLTFTHRSFQEYFTAKFIASTSDMNVKKGLLEKFYPDMWRDNIYNLVYELDTSFFETEVVLPFLKNMFNRIGLKNKVGKTHFLKYCKILYKQIEVEPTRAGITSLVNDVKTFHMVQIISHETSNLNSMEQFKSGSREFDKELIDKCKLRGGDRDVYEFGKLKTTDDFFVKLYNSDTYHSPLKLNYLLDVYNFLKEKHKTISLDLNKLLEKKAPNRL